MNTIALLSATPVVDPQTYNLYFTFNVEVNITTDVMYALLDKNNPGPDRDEVARVLGLELVELIHKNRGIVSEQAKRQNIG